MRYDLAVVGGGFCGTLLAANLVRGGFDGSVAMIEPQRIGPGLAYGTPNLNHVLNSPASAMSAFSDHPDHFVDWLAERGHSGPLVPRSYYGDYLNEIARDATRHDRIAVVRDLAVSASRTDGGFHVRTARGNDLLARQLALTTGNPPPADGFVPSALRADPRYFGDPWSFSATGIEGDVLLIGSGLTALDVLISLREEGFAGTVHVLSRHSKFPFPHATHERLDATLDVNAPSALNLVRQARASIRDRISAGYDWRAAIDAFRPNVNAIWQRLPVAEQSRFLRHAAGVWNVHRHRAPAPAHGARMWFHERGRLRSYAGRLQSANVGRALLTVEVSTPKGTIECNVGAVVNCTGPLADYGKSGDPLMRSLLGSGELCPDVHRLGLDVDPALRAVAASGRVNEDLFVLGPAARSRYFEGTAVPELRRLAEQLADHLVRDGRSALCQA